MPATNPLLPELTLIVAATQQMGIGRNGTLPWTGLRKEMAYFARVTKRLPPALSLQQQQPGQGTEDGERHQLHQHQHKVQNAVIMGRKTWESIPERFRPLPGRWNVVLSRNAAAGGSPGGGGEGGGEEEERNPVMAASLEDALKYLGGWGSAVGRVFVIGGAQIYRAALETELARRVLLTRVRTEFECDTFFPLRLDSDDEASAAKGWRRSGQEEMDAWVGEQVPEGCAGRGGDRVRV
ncbi:hypothetical protein VTH82DRAFT_768 [Thermothelomyces myriococcoides]